MGATSAKMVQNGRAIESLLAREAAKLECVLTIKADARQDELDILFVVQGDLFDGERAVLPLMRRLRDNFSNVPFDVMVLPASRYSEKFRWGETPRTIATSLPLRWFPTAYRKKEAR